MATLQKGPTMKRRRSSTPPPTLLLLLLVLLLFILHAPQTVEGQPGNHLIPCNETKDDCATRVLKGSECRNGICSNPFESGCLYTLLNKYGHNESLDQDGDSDSKWKGLLKRLKTTKRVCNSDDPTNATYCGTPTSSQLEYTEIRIHSLNWESAFFNAWILQILLSEVLSVPATIETGALNVNNSFYDPYNALGYGQQNHWESLYNAYRAPQGDCLQLPSTTFKKSKKKLDYSSCAHVIPEYWADGASKSINNTHGMKYMEEIGIIERPQALGAVGNQGLYITKFTAQQYPNLTSYLGFQGEENRPKLAALFQRPTTWKQYCDLISNSSCFLPDDIAHRPPHNPQEENRYHVPGLYTGYFRATNDNDCIANPTNCTGHVADFPCDWGSLLQSWIVHHDLPLSSDGRQAKYAYTSEEIIEMWHAANATQSHLLTLWYTPEGVNSKFRGTPAEMMRVAFPVATQDCMDHRIDIASELLCSRDQAPVSQTPEGACDYFPFTFQVIKSHSLWRVSHPEGLSEALHSPAYQAVSGYRISHLQLDAILRDWFQLSSSGYLADGFDPRLAACRWIHDNLEDILEDVVPDTYPRVLKQENIYDLPLYRAALFLGSLATCLCLVSGLFVWIRRDTAVMKHAQVDFLMCLLYGVFLVSLAAVLTALKPTHELCVANVWLIELGYTMELVPLIVKVTAINKLLTAAKKMRRVQINRTLLFAYVSGWMLFTIVGMTVWTVVDPPKVVKSFFLTEEQNDFGETIVLVETHCSSSVHYWLFAAMCFHFLLLMWAAVLAFQTRKIPQKFNESKVLVAVIYSQCLVLAVRVALLVLPEDAINPVVDTGLTSICLGVDSLLTLLIYFIPKLTLYHKTESSRRESEAGPKVYGWDNDRYDTRQTMMSEAHKAAGSHDVYSSDGESSKSSKGHGRARRVSLPAENSNGMTESRNRVEEEKTIATNLVSDLQQENTILKAETEVLKETNETLTHRVDQLEKEVLSLQQQLPPDEEEVTLQGHNSVLTSRITELEDQVALLQQIEDKVANLQEQVPPDEPEPEESSKFMDEQGSTAFFDPTNSDNTNADLFHSAR